MLVNTFIQCIMINMFITVYNVYLFRAQGDNLFNLFGSRWAASAKEYMLLAAAAIIPTVWLPSLSALAPLGAAGVTASMSVAALVRFLQLRFSICSVFMFYCALRCFDHHPHSVAAQPQ